MIVYLDESGDLGFKFDNPYRKGGSSRYLTLTFLLIPKKLSYLPKRIVKKIYKKRNRKTSNELKGSDLTPSEQIFFANEVVKLLKKHPEIKIFAITVYKKRVASHIRADANKLYNYMVGLALLQRIKKIPQVTFVPDARSIKVRSGNSLVDYLHTEIWFKLNSKTEINNSPQESHKVFNLQFVDYVTHIIWEKYEDRRRKAFNILKSRVGLKELFFPR